MKWTDSPPYRLSANNGRSYVGFCQKNSLGQSTAERQVAGHRGGERTTRPMSGVRTAPLCLEQLLLDLALIVGKAQKIDCLLKSHRPSGSGVAIPPGIRKWLQEECELTGFSVPND